MALTKRHLDVLRGLLDGKIDREIAKDLGLSVNTVKKHTSRIYQYIGIKGRRDLLRFVGDWEQRRGSE